MLGAYSYPSRFTANSVMANQLAAELEKLGAICRTSGNETCSNIRVTVSGNTGVYQVTLNSEGRYTVGQPDWSTIDDWDQVPVYRFLRCQKQREDSFTFLIRCVTDLQEVLGLAAPEPSADVEEEESPREGWCEDVKHGLV